MIVKRNFVFFEIVIKRRKFDLAAIYGYEVKKLNEQVKHNINRFPDDFMFRLTKDELEFVKSQIVTSLMNNMFVGQNCN